MSAADRDTEAITQSTALYAHSDESLRAHRA